MNRYKLGKNPYKPDKYGRDILYENYRVIDKIGAVPDTGGKKGVVPTFGMLGNDKYGDCGEAGINHGFMQTNAINNRFINFTDKTTEGDYGAITGFNPNDPNSDQGTDMKTAYGYTVKTGMLDSSGNRHKLGAYLLLNGSQAQIEEVIYIYGRAGIGINFPDYAMTAFDNGQAWDYKSGQKYTIDGGHYIEGIYYDASGVTIVTWGKEQLMTWAFFNKFCDESYLLVDPEFLNGSGVTPTGLNLTQLNTDLGIIKAGGVPITNVTPTPPSPSPTPITVDVAGALVDINKGLGILKLSTSKYVTQATPIFNDAKVKLGG